MIVRTQSSPPLAPWPASAPFYILVRRGLVQHLAADGEDGLGASLLIARSHADAIRLARWVSRVHGKRVSPAKVGTVRLSNGERETIEHVIAGSLIGRHGTAVMVPLGWREDGSPREWWKLELHHRTIDYPDHNAFGISTVHEFAGRVAAVLRGDSAWLAVLRTLPIRIET